MRLTCLKCGQQYELAPDNDKALDECVCGNTLEPVVEMHRGVEPNEGAAVRSRQKAFHAAGIARNVGAYALGISLLGVLFFPLGIVGAGVGIYCLTAIRGPLAVYSGKRTAALGVILGIAIFVAEGMALMSWIEGHETKRLIAMQAGVASDLKSLRRTQVLYHANHDGYGGFDDFRFKPATRGHTIFLGPDDLLPAIRDGEQITDPLPEGVSPQIGLEDFTAVAVANFDEDPALDVWIMTASGEPRHIADDLIETEVRNLKHIEDDDSNKSNKLDDPPLPP